MLKQCCCATTSNSDSSSWQPCIDSSWNFCLTNTAARQWMNETSATRPGSITCIHKHRACYPRTANRGLTCLAKLGRLAVQVWSHKRS
eukprot:4761995-Amphidinium_carterae.1